MQQAPGGALHSQFGVEAQQTGRPVTLQGLLAADQRTHPLQAAGFPAKHEALQARCALRVVGRLEITAEVVRFVDDGSGSVEFGTQKYIPNVMEDATHSQNGCPVTLAIRDMSL